MIERDDPFQLYDAAYVLGSLDLPDRRAFEIHLQSCDQCVAAVASLEDVAAQLGGHVPIEAMTPRPAASPDEPEVLAGLAVLSAQLAEIARVRRHRRVGFMVAGLTTLAAGVTAAVIVLVLAGTGRDSQPRPTALPVAMVAVLASPVHASASVRAVAWGTRIDVHCTYDNAHLPPGVAYDLVVIDRNRVSHPLGTWKLVPGQVTNFTAGTSLERSEIAQLQVTTDTGLPVLQLAL